ncbi:MAG: HD-GYP domain-containing protein [Nitrospinaceae bacterium]
MTDFVEYRPIDSQLLGKDFDCNFALYYLAKVEGQARFVMFADSIPQHTDKVRRLLASGDLEHELYIKEEDMVQYFAKATEVLRDMVNDPNRPAAEKAAKIYDVSKNVMQEFFEFHAPPQLLLNSEPVMEMMDSVLTDKSMGFSGLSRILNKDYYTYTHSVNVGMYCMTFGVKRGLPESEIWELGVGGMLHDAGKVKVAPEIINKNGKLTDEEFEEIKKHPEYGEKMLQPMGCFGQAILTMAGQIPGRRVSPWLGGGGHFLFRPGVQGHGRVRCFDHPPVLQARPAAL